MSKIIKVFLAVIAVVNIGLCSVLAETTEEKEIACYSLEDLIGGNRGGN